MTRSMRNSGNSFANPARCRLPHQFQRVGAIARTAGNREFAPPLTRNSALRGGNSRGLALKFKCLLPHYAARTCTDVNDAGAQEARRN
jgi:hypothetical protein